VKLIALLLLCGSILGMAIPSAQAQNLREGPFYCTLRHQHTEGRREANGPGTVYMTGVFYYPLCIPSFASEMTAQ